MQILQEAAYIILSFYLGHILHQLKKNSIPAVQMCESRIVVEIRS